MKATILVLAAIYVALAAGCSGAPTALESASEEAVDPFSVDIQNPVYDDDGTYCRTGDLAACELERQCSAGDMITCRQIGMMGPDESPGDVEPADYFTNADPEETLPDLQSSELPGGDLGQARQGFLSATWYGWRVQTGGNPGFQDIAGGRGFAPRNRCGTVAGQTCLFPQGPDLKSTWRWRWERGFAGDGGVSCGSLNSNDDFLIGLRRAFSAWSRGTGVVFTEVTSGEDITIYCDGFVVDRFDPNHRMHAAAYPFGNVNGPQANVIHEEFGQCFNNSTLPAQWLTPGPAYLYSAGGIVLNEQNMFATRNGGWGGCAGFNTDPNALVNIGERVGAHEVMHLMGFGHFQGSAQWAQRKPPCTEVVHAQSGPLEIPPKLKETFKNFVSQKRRESINFPAEIGFQTERDLACLDPDLTNGTSGNQLEGL